MDTVLPKELAYSPSLPALPECTSQEIVLSPVNGNTFAGGGQLIMFDLTSRGYMDPSSLYIRFKYSITNGATQSSTISGTPVFTFFQKLETLFGSTIVESINNYNQVCNMMVNLQNSVAMKYGWAPSYGWAVDAAANPGVPSLEQLDCRVCAENEGQAGCTVARLRNTTLAAPLPCILSASEKLIPLGLMPSVRIQLTTESIANIFKSSTNLPTGYTLSNVELCYTMIDFGESTNNVIKDMGDQFYIKSSSFTNAAATMTQGAGGSMELIYNMRLASIKSLFANFVGLDGTRCVNGMFDSVDVTSSNGEYVFNVGGTYYPSRPISTLNNKAGALIELKKAVGALHSTDYNFSISPTEFNSIDTTVTTAQIPGKFYLGVNLEKLSTNSALLTGISTQSSPINLRIQSGTQLGQNYTVNLIAMFDCLIQVDPINRQAIVKQ